MSRRFAVLVGMLLLGGCYAYRPIPVRQVRQGSDVRARISLAESRRLSPVIGRQDRTLDGQVLGWQGQRLLLSIPVAATDRIGYAEPLHQELRIPQEHILELEVRRLDRWKTAGLVGAGALVLAFFVFQRLDVESPSREPPPEFPPGNALRVPVRY